MSGEVWAVLVPGLWAVVVMVCGWGDVEGLA